MAKYRKRPVVISAIQLRWDTWNEVCDFIGKKEWNKGFKGTYIDKESLKPIKDDKNATSDSLIGLIIPTLEGDMLATQNDYIIQGVKNEFYPCKPDIFEATY